MLDGGLGVADSGAGLLHLAQMAPLPDDAEDGGQRQNAHKADVRKEMRAKETPVHGRVGRGLSTPAAIFRRSMISCRCNGFWIKAKAPA